MTTHTTLVQRDELDRFGEYVSNFQAGLLDDSQFTALRLQQGVYGQRQDGVHMIRIKIPGGRLNPDQLDAIAFTLERYCRTDIASITTRQDIQLHFVPLEDTPAVLRHLGEHGLTTREACGNTVRNITACPLAGACPHERTDVTLHVDAAARYFLRHPLTQHLPRKFKISFSGCASDCAQALIHDVGVVAVHENGQDGFRVFAGGGLGHKPHEAVVVHDFIPPDRLLPAIEAAIALHNRYSDRKKRAKSRLKFLVDRFGRDGFIERYRAEYDRIVGVIAAHTHTGIPWHAPASDAAPLNAAPRTVMAQRQPGLFTVPVALPLGDITAAQLRGIAALMRGMGTNDARATQEQNLLLLNVPQELVTLTSTQLGLLGLGLPEHGDDVVSCPGTWTCRLGVTASRTVAAKLNGGDPGLRIRVSGCQNQCAQPGTGDIGLHGEGRRAHGKLIPHYRMHFGGDGRMSGGVALKGPEVPTARIETAIERVTAAFTAERIDGELFRAWALRQGVDYFHTLLHDLTEIAEHDIPSLQRDHGETQDFKVLQLGGGECAGIADEYVAARFAEADNERRYRGSFWLGRKPDEALDCCNAMLRLGAQALVFAATRNAVPDDASDTLATRLLEISAAAHDITPLAIDYAALTLRTRGTSELTEADYAEIAAGVDRWLAEARTVSDALRTTQASRNEASLPPARGKDRMGIGVAPRA